MKNMVSTSNGILTHKDTKDMWYCDIEGATQHDIFCKSLNPTVSGATTNGYLLGYHMTSHMVSHMVSKQY